MSEICPYTGEVAEKFNDEHIFPDALGGGLDYKLRVSEDANSKLGSTIDSPLINSPLIQALRTEHGIKSRSGSPRWVVRGTLRDTNTKVEITYRQDQKPVVWVVNPVNQPTSGEESGLITCSADDLDKVLKNFIKGHERKGHSVELGPEVSLINQTVDVDLSVDLLAIKRALGKIAFGSLLHYLPGYASDPLVPEWRKLLFGTPEEAKAAQIYGSAFDTDKLFPILFPKLEPYEHAVTVVRIDEPRVLVGVTLFGTGFHNLVAVASSQNLYGLGALQGRIAVCNAKTSHTEIIDYSEAFRANRLGILVDQGSNWVPLDLFETDETAQPDEDEV